MKVNLPVDDYASRRPYISASEAHKTFSDEMHTFWNMKVGNIDPPDISHLEPIKRGKRIEKNMPEWVYEDYGMEIEANFDTYLSKKYPWAIATPDGFLKTKEGKYGIEFKAPSIFNTSYGEPDTDDIPQHNLVQVHHSMAVLPRLKGYYLFTYTESGITRYVIKKDKEIEEKLMEKECRFKGFVDENVPPPPRNEQDLIYHYFKSTNKTYLENPSNEVLDACNKLKEARNKKKNDKSNEDGLNFIIKRGIGDHSGIKFPDGKILRMDRCFSKPKVDEEKFFKDNPKSFKAWCTKFNADAYAKANPDSEYVVRNPYTKLHFPRD